MNAKKASTHLFSTTAYTALALMVTLGSGPAWGAVTCNGIVKTVNDITTSPYTCTSLTATALTLSNETSVTSSGSITVTNQGTDNNTVGISLESSTLTNSGTINVTNTKSYGGYSIWLSATTLTNIGTITATSANGGASYGIGTTGGANTVIITNSGTISGTGQANGIIFSDAATVTNNVGGIITGTSENSGFGFQSNGTLNNSGTLRAVANSGNGLYMNGGTLTNNGIIEATGTTYGVNIAGGTLVLSTGSILTGVPDLNNAPTSTTLGIAGSRVLSIVGTNITLNSTVEGITSIMQQNSCIVNIGNDSKTTTSFTQSLAWGGGGKPIGTVRVYNNATLTASADLTTKTLTLDSGGTLRNSSGTITVTNAFSPAGTYVAVVSGTAAQAIAGTFTSTGGINLANCTLTVDVAGLTLAPGTSTGAIPLFTGTSVSNVPADNAITLTGNTTKQYTVTGTNTNTALGGGDSYTITLTAPAAPAPAAGASAPSQPGSDPMIQAAFGIKTAQQTGYLPQEVQTGVVFLAQSAESEIPINGLSKEEQVKIGQRLTDLAAQQNDLQGSAREVLTALGEMGQEKFTGTLTTAVTAATNTAAQVAGVIANVISTNMNQANYFPVYNTFMGTAVSAGHFQGEKLGLTPWAKGLTATEQQKRISGYGGYDTSSNGLTIGIASVPKPGMEAGVAFSYFNTKNTEKLDHVSGTQSDSYMLSLYGTLSPEKTWVVDGSVIVGVSENKTDRLDIARTLYQKATHSYTAFAQGQWGHYVKVADSRVILKPFLAAQGSCTHTPSSVEGGGSLPITLKTDRQYSAQVGFGLNAAYAATLNEDWRAIPELSGKYMHELNGRSRIVNAIWLGQPIGIPTPELGREVVTIGIGMKMKERTGFSLDFDYTATLKNKYASHAGTLKVSYAL
jgi:hypothetical protein